MSAAMNTSSNLWYHLGGIARDGFMNSKKRFNPDDLDIDCSEKVFMVTGGNAGVGKSIAAEIARRAGKIHLICRNEDKGEAARKEIVETTGNPHIHVHIVDMSCPRNVSQFVKRFLAEKRTVDVLVNNAGCICTSTTRELTPDGLEKTFSTNVLGCHVLTEGLMPTLQQSPEPRVIMVSCAGMLLQRFDAIDFQFEKMQPYDGLVAYEQTKRQMVVMAEQYSSKYLNVHFASMHPGLVDTQGLQTAMPELYSQWKSRLRTPEEGADTAVWLAISSEALKHPSGLFFQDRRPVSTHLPLAWTRANKKEEEEFMEVLDKMTQQLIGNRELAHLIEQ